MEAHYQAIVRINIGPAVDDREFDQETLVIRVCPANLILRSFPVLWVDRRCSKVLFLCLEFSISRAGIIPKTTAYIFH